MRTLLSALLALTLTSGAIAEVAALHIACAANFRSTLVQLTELYQADSGRRVLISSASTGALYAQIVNGARYDLLLAADTWRPRRLADRGLALADSLVTYAIGQLALVSHQRLPPAMSADRLRTLLGQPGVRVALANPQTAPYGSAAQQVLQQVGLWAAAPGEGAINADHPANSTIIARTIIANNVAQAFQFFSTGNTEFALVGSAQWRHWQQQHPSRVWQVPTELHAPLTHGAIITRSAQAPDRARDFLDYLLSARATAIIVGAGYRRPSGGHR